jgi:hypothetical protein
VRRQLTYANVAATLALVFSMSGGALAASHYLISSTRQINPKVLRKLRGNTGKTGPTGKPGAQGLQGVQGVEGKVGPSEAISSQTASESFPSAPNAAEIVRKISLPAGSYTLSATVIAANEDASTQQVECILLHEESTLGQATVSLPAKNRGDLALSGVFSTSVTAEMWLACKSTTASGGYESPTLTATKVGSLG